MPYYRAATWILDSDFELPALPSVENRPADIRIRRGPVAAHLPGATSRGPDHEVRDGEFLLTLGQLRCLVRDGREVFVQAPDGTDEGMTSAVILGPALAVLGHQRGLVPLSASAIEVHGRAVALAGQSACGKSTLAAHLVRRGYPLMSDDTVLAVPDSKTIHPCLRHIRLWRDALAVMGLEPEALSRDRAGLERYRLPPEHVGDRALPLDRIYLLEWAPVTAPDCFERLRGVSALRAIEPAVLLPSLLPLGGGRAQQFQRVAALVGQTTVIRWSRRLDVRDLAAHIDALVRHFESALSPG